MKKKGTYDANGTVAQLWGGPTDANAFWFKSGNDDILNPLFKTKKLKKGPAKFVPALGRGQGPDDLRADARPDEQQHPGRRRGERRHRRCRRRDAEGEGPQAHPALGQDATVQGVQNIISGWQTMTVYKYVPDEANAAAAAAIALYKGKKPPRRDAANGEGEAGVPHPGVLDHQGELHAALQGRVPQAERGLLRGVQAVLQVVV